MYENSYLPLTLNLNWSYYTVSTVLQWGYKFTVIYSEENIFRDERSNYFFHWHTLFGHTVPWHLSESWHVWTPLSLVRRLASFDLGNQYGIVLLSKTVVRLIRTLSNKGHIGGLLLRRVDYGINFETPWDLFSESVQHRTEDWVPLTLY